MMADLCARTTTLAGKRASAPGRGRASAHASTSSRSARPRKALPLSSSSSFHRRGLVVARALENTNRTRTEEFLESLERESEAELEVQKEIVEREAELSAVRAEIDAVYLETFGGTAADFNKLGKEDPVAF